MSVLMIFSRIFFKILSIWLVSHLLNTVKVKTAASVPFNWVTLEASASFHSTIFSGILVNFITGRENCVNRYACVDHYFSGRAIPHYFPLM